MAVAEVVRWDAVDSVYAWKFPSISLATWSQLIVSQSQEAVLLKEGRMLGPFLPGRYSLDTNNIPGLGELFKIPFGGKTPFTAEVWFVNKTVAPDLKWGFATPVQIADPTYHIMVPVHGYGQYGVQVHDTRRFLTKRVGTQTAYDRNQLNEDLRGVIATHTKTCIAQLIIDRKISVLEMSARLTELSDALTPLLEEPLAGYGLKLFNFQVASLYVPDADPAVVSLKTALANSSRRRIEGTTYQQERSFDVLESAAGNPGSASASVMGAGLGIGMGVAMGGPMGSAMGQAAMNINPGGGINAAGWPCPKCSATNPADAKFCSTCGAAALAPAPAPAAGGFCSNCGKAQAPSAKFCNNCGRQL